MAYDLNRVTAEFHSICLKAGAVSAAKIPVKLNGRLTKTLGRVTESYDKEFDIYSPTLVEFSKQLIETSTDKSIHDVIYHEAAHAILTERTHELHGHDSYFKAICAEIGTENDTCKTKVERTVSESAIYRYTIKCNTCNKTIGGYTRMCATLKNISQCYCKTCKGSDLSVIKNW